MLIEKFNSKYSNLSNKQKNVLKEYINNINDTAKLKEFINENLTTAKKELNTLKSKINDKVIEIKLTEIISFIKPIPSKSTVKDDHIVSLLQYYQLIDEIKNTNE
jgi:hypothetical protein